MMMKKVKKRKLPNGLQSPNVALPGPSVCKAHLGNSSREPTHKPSCSLCVGETLLHMNPLCEISEAAFLFYLEKLLATEGGGRAGCIVCDLVYV